MTRPYRVVGPCVVVLVTVASAAQRIPETISTDSPDRLVFQDLVGAERRLADYRGRIVVLNFWATFCEPCREEMPLLLRIQRRYEERGVVVIGASADDAGTQAHIPAFIRKLGITFPIWKGATTQHMEMLGLGAGLPATAVIDQNGRLAFRILGILERKELEQRLEYLLTGQQGSPPEPLVDRISEAMKKGAPHGHGDHHEGEEGHSHGGLGMEGASTVPS